MTLVQAVCARHPIAQSQVALAHCLGIVTAQVLAEASQVTQSLASKNVHT